MSKFSQPKTGERIPQTWLRLRSLRAAGRRMVSRERVATAMITGSSGETTTTNMLAHILQSSGKSVGKTTTEGISFNNRCVFHGDCAGFKPAWWVMTEPGLDAAVLETARGDFLRRGRAYLDRADVTALTNVGDVHIGVDGIDTRAEMAALKNRILRHATDAAVLNIDNSYCAELAKTYPVDIRFLVGRRRDAPILADHLTDGGRAVYLEERDSKTTLVYEHRGAQTPVLCPDDMPATLGGVLDINTDNAMVATALALGMHCTPEQIANGLTTFELSEEHNPGRFTFLKGFTPQILIIFGANAFKIEPAIRALDKMQFNGRKVCILQCADDKSPEDVQSMANMLGARFDTFYLHNKDYDVGVIEETPNGAITTIMELLRANGTASSQVTFCGSAKAAVRAAMVGRHQEDIIVYFGNSMERAKKAFQAAAKAA